MQCDSRGAIDAPTQVYPATPIRKAHTGGTPDQAAPDERPTHGRNRSTTHHPLRRFGGSPREVPTIRADITTPADRRAALDSAARLRHLPEADRDIIRLAGDPLFPRLLEQSTATGGCAHPVHLTGHTTTLNATTGEILHHYGTRTEPGERLLVRCRNRRASVCPPCSRLFATLTAPSFGPVHRTTTDRERCRPRRDAGTCPHGTPPSCTARHTEDDPRLGQPLCSGCYDGPNGPHTPPPAWGTVEALTAAVRTAAASVTVTTPYSPALGDHALRWGAQLDTRPLRAALDATVGLADDAVAAYVAKYVTKSAADTMAGADHRLRTPDDIDAIPASLHVRALMHTCWRLGGLPELGPLRLRAWTHTLGYRGHILGRAPRRASDRQQATSGDRNQGEHSRNRHQWPVCPDC
ncbi:replication initiator [Streptomyces roseoverticillatus]|uniref:Replication initiator n=1 Tax=Streptomyces roseoverticillatus TaxID=66429 RepID=A0ABV3IVX6_9ACTN